MITRAPPRSRGVIRAALAVGACNHSSLVLANIAISCSRSLPMERDLLLTLFANVLAIIGGCSRSTLCAHIICQRVLKVVVGKRPARQNFGNCCENQSAAQTRSGTTMP